VLALSPQHLYAAMDIARLQEETICDLKISPDRGLKPIIVHPNSKPLLRTPSSVNRVISAVGVPPMQ